MDYLKELYDIEHYDLAKSGLSEAQANAVLALGDHQAIRKTPNNELQKQIELIATSLDFCKQADYCKHVCFMMSKLCREDSRYCQQIQKSPMALQLFETLESRCEANEIGAHLFDWFAATSLKSLTQPESDLFKKMLVLRFKNLLKILEVKQKKSTQQYAVSAGLQL